MERLCQEALPPDFEDESPKEFYICVADSIENLPERIDPTSTYYASFLAMDARDVDGEKIARAATKLLARGLVCLCTWGPDCERVHDLFDKSAFNVNENLTGNDVILTYWHNEEPLLEALWFFVHAALVTESFAKQCSNWIIASVENPEWEREIRERINGVVFEPPEDEEGLST